MQQAMGTGVLRQSDLREIDRGSRGAIITIANQFFRHFNANIGLCLYR